MKKLTITISIFLILLIGFGVIYTFVLNLKSENITANNSTEKNIVKFEEEEYSKNVKDFIVITPEELSEKVLSNENNYVYFGRQTCPYCRAFVPKLNKLSKERKINIYYIDTENTDTDIKLQELRSKLNIETVPSLLLFKNNGNTVTHYDSEKEELENFIE